MIELFNIFILIFLLDEDLPISILHVNANFHAKFILVHDVELLVVHVHVHALVHAHVLILIQLLVLLVLTHLPVYFHLLQHAYDLKHLFLSRFIITHTIPRVHLAGNLKIHVLTLMIDDVFDDGLKHVRLICLYSIFNFYSFLLLQLLVFPFSFFVLSV